MTTITVPQRLMRPVATRPARRSMLLGFIAGLAVGALLTVGASLLVGVVAAGTVMPGVRVAGVDVAGLDRAGAEARLRAELPSLTAGHATIAVDDVRVEIGYGELGRDYDYAAMVDAAFAVARTGDPLTAGIDRLQTLVHATELPAAVHAYDAASVERLSETLAERVEIARMDASVAREGANFTATGGVEGRAVEPSDVRAALSAALDSTDPSSVTVSIEPTIVEPDVTTAEAWRAALQAERTARGLQLTLPGAADDEARDPALRLSPETIAGWLTFAETPDGYGVVIDEAAVDAAVAALAETIDQEAVNARFAVADGGGLAGVIPGQDGRLLQVGESADALLATLEGRAAGTSAGSLLLNVTVEEPALSTADAEAALPQMQMVSTWTTNYVSGPSNGYSANISIPAWDLDGYTLAPGEWFSFWEGIGPVTRERGYTDGGVILNGRSQPTGALAGGICSTSTTLFNAAMRFGLEIGDRAAHYYYIDRYPVGLDATVSIIDGWVQDMTFRNDTDAPIVIRGFASPGRVTFQLWSIPNGRTVALSAPTTWDHVAAGDTVQVDPSMAPGTSRRVESPINGFKSSVSRTVYDADGNVIHENTWFSDYRAVTGIVVSGPSAAAPPAEGATAAGSGGTDGGGVAEDQPAAP